MNILLTGMGKAERWRVIIQVTVTGVILAMFVFSNGAPMAVFIKLLVTSIISILLSTLIVNHVSLKAVLNSVVINLIVAFLFFFAGMLLQDHFSFEQNEMSAIDPGIVDAAGKPVGAKVITASVFVFSGWEFFCLYIINGIFAYLKFLRKDEVESIAPPELINRDKFSVKQGNKTHFIAYQDVYCVEASGNYLNIFDSNAKYVVRMSLGDWYTTSGKEYFIRVHRSFIINSNHIREMLSSADGLPVLVLKNEMKVKLGKQYKEETLRKLGV
jgi:LytTr DNA-binding domain